MISPILILFAGPHWSRFYSFQGLMGLCDIKNPKVKKPYGFSIYEPLTIITKTSILDAEAVLDPPLMSFDFLVMSFL